MVSGSVFKLVLVNGSTIRAVLDAIIYVFKGLCMSEVYLLANALEQSARIVFSILLFSSFSCFRSE